MSGRQVVAVVGGGCAGVLASVAVLRRTDADVVLIEPGEPGGGVAYGPSARPWHLLNSRAGAMSAFPDDPGHFVRWAGVERCDFVPRRIYGRYLREVLDWAAVAHPGRLRWVPGRVADVRTDPVVVLEDGREIRADEVVLALGNPAVSHPAGLPAAFREHPSYVADPWRPGALESLPRDRPILLIGTGLTAVDVALTLTSEGGEATDSVPASEGGEATDSVPEKVENPDAGPGAFWDGPAWDGRIGGVPWNEPDWPEPTADIIAFSRRGMLPLEHVEQPAELAPPTLTGRSALRDLIRAIREAAGTASDWRAVVDGLRPDTDQLWSQFSDRDRDAFLRHLSRVWECHRHRMAPPVAARIAQLRGEGRLRVRAGAPPAGLAVGGIVNCAGPGRLPYAATGLTATLLRKGLARVGPHSLGLDVDHTGRIHRNIWVIGPLRRGVQWETTAVPEIRSQARDLAEDIAGAETLWPAA
ncbi:FAD/NAD(P)-binding protein [Actinoplanes sp. NBRC 103695]|uniref:FAD/NAD(P)-binding protein n=1 Tax=Actinoplanes sp. NBRC 103695 TaxID=3032202 RepID=UPI0024A17EEF|nr:FAD/NAD(P)-binding protein [Actinoplanes sp. NBRC 103695]GLY94423.1 hypothetical protein Acsp02_16790 [Actinoplanes sp. NBRC 103695]